MVATFFAVAALNLGWHQPVGALEVDDPEVVVTPYVIPPDPGGGAPSCGSSHVHATAYSYSADAQLLTFRVVASGMDGWLGGMNKEGWAEVYIYDQALGNDHEGPFYFVARNGWRSPELYVRSPQSPKAYLVVLIQNANRRTVCQQLIYP